MTQHRNPFWFRRWLDSSATSVAVIAFLLHFVWEFLQVPLFADMPEMAHWDAVRFCARAALGDAVITLAAFWVVTLVYRDRHWILAPAKAAIAGFIAVGVVITVALEWHATVLVDRWQYAERMPTIPLLGTGLAPLLQWLILPPLVVWIARRQILGQRYLSLAREDPD
ncbi:hypothetical protein TVNIR_1565 [Thioalkalivibrio nitratireducens DSM 14787]|uniref:Uncharacterized protein n=1 Tax=Thioalkalivibrio nitratireducens (strain DSM 14787 / UNIQEM 213 / ALEN2) TaxID=1255043 RepID=L0DXX2_THIND|nr:hypothetical protein [Thioalkalivibrio nitratireducens]AGA33231.1 hypothetical protein TVNIR_1565 [Thioalkalivibrio nitratireducens DSM 14787]